MSECNGKVKGGCTNCGQCSSGDKVGNPERRKVLGLITGVINGAIGLAILGPVVGFVAAPMAQKAKMRWIPVLGEGELANGETREVHFTATVKDGYREVEQAYSIFLRRYPDKVAAFDPSCTHLGCRVTLQEDKDRYFCPCHGGVFDLDGKVVSGPPPKPLIQYRTKVESGQIWIEKAV
jgi:menaquinol-cytochrome c reductase iron-sulfur subunit